MIIYEKTPGALISSSERTVAIFESGLCRIDQRYTCTNESASIYRTVNVIGEPMPDGNSTPAIDGVFIFPTPQEIKRQDGFTDFIISGYGRTSKNLQNLVLSQKRIRSATQNGDFSVWDLTGEICLKKNEVLTLDMLGLDAFLFNPFDYRLASYPEAYMLSATETSNVSIGTGFATTTYVDNKEYGINGISPPKRYYRIEMTTDGVTVADNGTGSPLAFNIMLRDPIITITAARPFGEFVEILFQTERENTVTVVV